MQKNKNWGIFDFCNQFLQTEDQLFTATLDLCHRLGSKNVIYAEIRFCPDLHIVKGLTPEQALLAVIKGMNFTVWKFHDFSITHILREIKVGESRFSKIAILAL